MSSSVIHETAALFGDLWHRYDDNLFKESVQLFAMRFEANGFDLDWFQGKKCLDAGCGGGRYTIAMGLLGASEAIGCDISEAGLADARNRALSLGAGNCRFEKASVLDLPFPDESFDFVCCSGVLHHTADPEKGLHELVRVLRPGGKAFLLLYGEGGVRWPTIMKIRPHAQSMGYELMDDALHLAELPANKQRTFLDDFFVPVIKFYDWERIRKLLSDRGLTNIERWQKGKLDHESSVEVQRKELKQLEHLFKIMSQQPDRRYVSQADHIEAAAKAVALSLAELDQTEFDFQLGKFDKKERDWKIFGWGHHRVLAVKS